MKSGGDIRNLEGMLKKPMPKTSIDRAEGRLSVTGMGAYIGQQPITKFAENMLSFKGEDANLRHELCNILLDKGSASDKARLLELFVERQNPIFVEELSKLFDEHNLLDMLYKFHEDYQIFPQKSLALFKKDIQEILNKTIELHLQNAMKFLIEAGADFNSVDENYQYLLHFAAQLGNIEAIKFFVSIGADVNSADNNGQTPLHKAALLNDVPAILFLVDGGARVPEDLQEKVGVILDERETRFKEDPQEMPEESEGAPSTPEEEALQLLQGDRSAAVDDQPGSVNPEEMPDLSPLEPVLLGGAEAAASGESVR